MSKTRFLIILFCMMVMAPSTPLKAQDRYQVGVCDWMVLKRQKLGAFELAKQLGCDGIELDWVSAKPSTTSCATTLRPPISSVWPTASA